MTYSEKLQDPRWQKKRLRVFERDDFTCRDCGAENKPLHVHHCSYFREPWDADLNMLLTLCDECHRRRQEAEDDIKWRIENVLAWCNISFLLTFQKSAVEFSDNYNGDQPAIIGEFKLDYLSDGRWWEFAQLNPWARPAYEAVVNPAAVWETAEQEAPV